MDLVPVGYKENITLYGGEGLQWVDAETIGRMLYPQQKSPDRAVRQAFTRNEAHFTEKDTIILKVETAYNMMVQNEPSCSPKESTRKQTVRFFSMPHGVIKICKASRSKIAFEVIERIVDLHEAFIRGILPKPQPTLLALARLPLWDRRRGAGLKALALAENVHENTIRRRVKKVAAGEPLQKKRGGYVCRKYRDIYNDAIRLKKQGLNALKIAEKLGIPDKTLYHWFEKPLIAA